MNLHFLFPAWFLLIFPSAFILVKWKSENALSNILRTAFFIVLIIALAQPRLKFENRGGVIVVIADKSKSMPPGTKQRQKEIIRLLEKEKGDRDMLAVVGFSEDINAEQLPDTGKFDGFKGYYSGNASNMASAVEMAYALIPKDRHGRIFVMSDGLHTGMSPLDLECIGKKKNIPIDYRTMSRPHGKDLAVLDINMPSGIEQGEAFQFSAEIFVPEKTEVKYLLKRDGKRLAAGKTLFAPGKRLLLFQDRLKEPGSAKYTLEISSSLNDPVKENNLAKTLASVNGARPILHVGNKNSRLLKLAANGGLKMIHKDIDKMDWTLSGLSKYKAVILENTPAIKLGVEGQDALKNFVESAGGGLMVSGGRQSFGIGGYYKTPVAEALPVTMELRREHRKLTTAVVVALDRSGSMRMPVPGGRTKMDLANQGTASVLELLSDADYLGVLAVDSQAHIVLDTQKISNARNMMEHKIRSIKSMGGGIFIFEALLHSSKMLSKIQAGTRHIILFADAADSEEPGNYQELIKNLRKVGITISVIGLGTEKDCDADLLKDIAKLGGGNIYFSNSAKELPQLFAQETLTVFRGAFIEEKTRIKKSADLSLVCNIPMQKPPPLGGYNLTYLAPKASLGLVTDDEYTAPVLAFWSYGSGRALAFTGEIDGKFTGDFGAWKKSGEIFLSCLRWINQGADEDSDVFPVAERIGNDVLINIELDPSRKKDPFVKMPRLIHLRETETGIVKQSVPFKWKNRDSLSAKTSIKGKDGNHFYIKYRKEGEENDKVIPCAAMSLPYPQEHAPELNPARGPKTLSRLANATQGKERMSLDGIFDAIPPFERYIPIWHYLATLAIFILLAEVICRRMGLGFKFSSGQSQKNIKVGTMKKAPRRKKTEKMEEPEKEPEEAVSGSVLGAISKAKEKSRKRMK
jgi:Mg-chelatase subunit ChlD